MRTIGILGAGQIVANMHLPVLLAMPGVRIAWLMDQDAEKAKNLARAFHVPAAATADLERVLAGVDAVLVAIPYGAREPYYTRLRAGGIDALYVEKPFARTLEEHRRYCEGFPRAAVGFLRRAWGPLTLLREVLRLRALGPMRQVTVEYGAVGQLTGSNYSADFHLARGGMLFEVAIHWLDAALFAIEATGAEVRTGRMLRKGDFDIHTEAEIVAATPEGEIAFRLLATGLKETRNLIEIGFEHGSLRLDQGAGGLTLHGPGGGQELQLAAAIRPHPVTPYQLCYQTWSAWLGDLEHGTRGWTAAQSSAVTTKIIEELYGLSS